MDNKIELIRAIVEDCMENLTVPMNKVGNDDNLFDLGMDSITSIKIVVALEQKFDFEFEDEKLTIDTLSSVNSLYDYIIQRLS